MNKLILIPLLVVALSGCGGTKNVLVPTTKRVVVLPPAHMLECPEIPWMITGEELQTQADAAKNIKALYDVAKECRENLEATKHWLETSKEVFEAED